MTTSKKLWTFHTERWLARMKAHYDELASAREFSDEEKRALLKSVARQIENVEAALRQVTRKDKP
jgi:hypothetical protein